MQIPWQPRYWPVWIGFGLLRLLVWLPYSWQMALGRTLGRLLRRVMRSRDRIAHRNLELTAPENNEDQHQQLLTAMWSNIGCMIFEIGLAWFGSGRKVRKLISHIDISELERMAEAGKGIVLLAAHFTHVELVGRMLCLHGLKNMAGLYREHGNAALQWHVSRSRFYADKMFTRTQTRGAIRHLRRGGLLWYAPDQDYERGESVFVPFYGVMASTTTSAHHLARMGNAVIMVVSGKRTDEGYRVVVSPPMPGLPSEDVDADCRAINLAMESMIRECPDQYLWIHRRFKNRPEGEDPVY